METAIVIGFAFGPFIYSSTLELIEPSTLPATAEAFEALMVHEIVVGALLLAFLIVRGWRFSDLGFARFHWTDLLGGVSLTVFAIFAYQVLWLLFSPPDPIASEDVLGIDSNGVSPLLILTFSILNGSFEELFVCAYLLSAWRSAPAQLLIAASAMLRLSYHLYQGPYAALALFPLGIIFAWYFTSRRRLLPLIIAHASLDALALFPFVTWE